jgi:hypothetical protein
VTQMSLSPRSFEINDMYKIILALLPHHPYACTFVSLSPSSLDSCRRLVVKGMSTHQPRFP